MADENLILDIYNSDGTSFHNLCLHKFTFEDTTMGLSTKIDGDIFYKDNTLLFSMKEYVVYQNVKYSLKVDVPPVIVQKGLADDNGDLKGMTKYSLTFYHPMCQLFNIPFRDVAINNDEKIYKSEDNSFYWKGTLTQLKDKINNCLVDTPWSCELQVADSGVQSDIIQFNNQMISDVLKIEYDTFNVPYIINGYNILLGAPWRKIYKRDGITPFVFKMGSGLGLTNNDRTPKNNLIITRIAGYGSEDNIPNGYPKIKWTGDQSWKYSINNDSSAINSYPIIDGIIDGIPCKLINHPFTRKHLMPNIYVDSVNKKVNGYAVGYNPSIDLIDYYDATDPNIYFNLINSLSPAYYQKAFDGSDKTVANIKPSIVGATYNGQEIDVVKSISWINDDKTAASAIDDTYDTTKQKYKQGYFQIELYPLGFDLYAMAAVTSAMSINMTSGPCNGCKFDLGVDWDVVKQCFYDDNGNFNPNLQKRWDNGSFPNSTNDSIKIIVKKDTTTFGTLLPNTYQQPAANNKFVILGIDLPELYITNAQGSLDTAMKSFMRNNNNPKYEYPLEFDKYFLSNNKYILNQISTNSLIDFEYNGSIKELSVKEFSIIYGDSALPTYKITLTDDISISQNQIEQISSDVNNVINQISSLQTIYNGLFISELAKKLSKTEDDTANGLIRFLRGLEVGFNSMGIDELGNATLKNVALQLLNAALGINIGTDFSISQLGDAILKSVKASDNVQVGDYQTGLLGKGAKIDSAGKGEMRSLTLWESLSVPKLEFNRVEVLVGMDFQTKGGGLIDSVTIDKDGNGNDLNSGTCKLHLEDGEFGAIAAGDLCMGIFHNFGGSNSTEDVDNHTGLISKKGFNTSYFQITEITDTSNNGEFKYILRNDSNWPALSHPQPHMNFAQRGNTGDTSRQSFKYRTTEYSIGLTNVNTWEFGSGNIYYLEGNIDGWTIGGKTFTGTGLVIGNAYIFGSIDQFEKIGYTMSFDGGGDNMVACGEIKHMKSIIKNGYGTDATSLFSNWTITRNTGDTASDNIWNASAVISSTGEFDIYWTSEKTDLGTGLATIFTVTATKDGESVAGNLTI